MYGSNIALNLTTFLFSDENNLWNDALNYDYPYALDSETKNAYIDVLNPSFMDYFSYDGIRDVGEYEDAYHNAGSLIYIDSVYRQQAEIADTVDLVVGGVQLVDLLKAAPVILKSVKGIFGGADEILTAGAYRASEYSSNWAVSNLDDAINLLELTPLLPQHLQVKNIH